MSTSRLAIAVLAGSLVIGSVVASLADSPATSRGRSLDLQEEAARRDDAETAVVVYDDDDRDPRRGDSGKTRGKDGTSGGDDTSVANIGGSHSGGYSASGYSGGGSSG